MQDGGAVTLPILQRHTMRDVTLQQLVEDIKQGKLRKELGDSGYKECFQELCAEGGRDEGGQNGHPQDSEG